MICKRLSVKVTLPHVIFQQMQSTDGKQIKTSSAGSNWNVSAQIQSSWFSASCYQENLTCDSCRWWMKNNLLDVDLQFQVETCCCHRTTFQERLEVMGVCYPCLRVLCQLGKHLKTRWVTLGILWKELHSISSGFFGVCLLSVRCA